MHMRKIWETSCWMASNLALCLKRGVWLLRKKINVPATKHHSLLNVLVTKVQNMLTNGLAKRKRSSNLKRLRKWDNLKPIVGVLKSYLSIGLVASYNLQNFIKFRACRLDWVTCYMCTEIKILIGKFLNSIYPDSRDIHASTGSWFLDKMQLAYDSA